MTHKEVTASDTAADVEDALIGLQAESFQEILARLLTARRDVSLTEDFLVAENTVGRILVLVEEFLDGLETVMVLKLDFLEQEAHLVAVVLELNKETHR